jgi:hypothetical protein
MVYYEDSLMKTKYYVLYDVRDANVIPDTVRRLGPFYELSTAFGVMKQNNGSEIVKSVKAKIVEDLK